VFHSIYVYFALKQKIIYSVKESTLHKIFRKVNQPFVLKESAINPLITFSLSPKTEFRGSVIWIFESISFFQIHL